MKTPQCFLCEKHITAINDSQEHLILNAIGGRRKIRGFICVLCNNGAGQGWDAALDQQLNPLSLFFNIVRERGSIPPQTFDMSDGTRVEVNSQGFMVPHKPTYEEVKIGAGIRITLNARSLSEARTMLSGAAKKYPQFDPEEILRSAKINQRYTDSMLNFTLEMGGVESGRSIVKSTLALACVLGISPAQCGQALMYLRNMEGDACFGYYYQRDVVSNRPPSVPLHCVAIESFPDRKMLLGYVEFFGVHRMVVSLSDDYEGPKIKDAYSIDPRNGDELELSVDINFSSDEVLAIFNYERIPDGSIEAAFDLVMPSGISAAFDREQSRVLAEAVKYAFKNCGLAEGETILPEHAPLLTSLMMEKLTPFLLHRISAIGARRAKNNHKTGDAE